jgi:hypothetical protein
VIRCHGTASGAGRLSRGRCRIAHLGAGAPGGGAGGGGRARGDP